MLFSIIVKLALCLDIWRDPSAVYYSGVMEEKVRERKAQLETSSPGVLDGWGPREAGMLVLTHWARARDSPWSALNSGWSMK